jgi:PAS domain S-box-containing protein
MAGIRTRLTLVHKGLLVALIPLVIQVVLALSLSTLWRQTEREGNVAFNSAFQVGRQSTSHGDLENELRSGWAEQMQLRKQLNIYLIAAGSLNLMFAVIVSTAFILGIARRLEMINENVQSFAEGKMLRAPFGGKDELAQLDSVFYKMAQSLKDAQERLSISEARLRMLIETLPTGVIVINQTGIIEQVNDTFKRSFKHTGEQLTGRPVNELILKLDLNSISNKTTTIETTALTGDEMQIPVEVNLRQWQMPDGSRMLLAVNDISERRRLDQLRQEFVAMVTHDLRTPLTSIQLFHQLLASEAFGQLQGNARETLGAAERSVARLLRLVDNLLDIEKLEAGQFRLNMAKTRLSSIINRSIETVQTLARERGITIENTTDEIEIAADEERLIQVLVNLLSNAVKFSPQGSSVSINAISDDSGWLEVSIQDHGKGIPQSKQVAIFEKYHQIDPSSESERRGTGLGLPICKSIIEQHGGTIHVASEPAKGSRFWFRIPVRH